MDYAQQIKQHYLDLIEEAKRQATPDIQRRVGYSSPLAGAYLQQRVAEPLLRDVGVRLADLLEQQRREEAQRQLAREGWEQQLRQQQLARQWQADQQRAQQAYDERVYERNLAMQRQLADEIARRQEEEANRTMLWQLIPNLLTGAGMALFPATFGINAIAGMGMGDVLRRGMGRFLAGALGGPSYASMLAARQLGYANPYLSETGGR